MPFGKIETCQKCRKTDWEVVLRIIRGKNKYLCNSCYRIEKISNDGE